MTSPELSSFAAAAANRDRDALVAHSELLLSMNALENADSGAVMVLTRVYKGLISRIRVGTRLNGRFLPNAESVHVYDPPYPPQDVFDRMHVAYMPSGEIGQVTLPIRNARTTPVDTDAGLIFVREFEFGRSSIGPIECRDYWRNDANGSEFLVGEIMRRVDAPRDLPIRWLYLCAQVGPADLDFDLDAAAAELPWPPSQPNLRAI